MIIFDTSVLFGPGLDDARFDLLWALKRSGQQKVAIPWMVREELVAQRTLDHAQAHEKAVAAIRGLNRTAAWMPQREPTPFAAETVKEHWRTIYGNLFEVIDTSGEAALQALSREAYCQKPANGPDRKDKGGARDVAIWLSVIDYLKANPDEKVVFVSRNTSDFGDGDTYLPPMTEDLTGLEDRLTHLTSFDAVVSTFSMPLSIDEEHIQSVLTELLSTPETRGHLAAAARQILNTTTTAWRGNLVQGTIGSPIADVDFPPTQWTAWVRTPKAILWHINDVSGHRIGDEPWYTATVDWILTGMATVISAASDLTLGQIACQWSTKLLFTPKQGEAPTILRYGSPDVLPPDEKPQWESLVPPSSVTMDIQTARTLARSLLEAAATAASNGSTVDATRIIWGVTRRG